MKTITGILSAISFIFLFGCSDDTTINNQFISQQFTISGNIENWNMGGNIELKAQLFDTSYWGNRFIMDSGLVSASGVFSLKFADPPASYLYPIIIGVDSPCVGSVIINPPNIKSSSSADLVLFNDSIAIGYLFKSNISTDSTLLPGQFFVYFMYLDRNVNISGSMVCTYYSSKDTIIYDVSGVRGWNKVVTHYSSFSSNGSKIIVTSTEPAGGRWYVHSWSSNSVDGKSHFPSRIYGFNNCIKCK